MSRIEHYIHDVGLHLAASSKDKDRFLGDLRDQAREMLESGLTETEVIEKLGPGRDVAAEFMKSRPLTYAGILVRFLAFLFDSALSTLFIFSGIFLFIIVPMGLADPEVFWSFRWGQINPPALHLGLYQLIVVIVLGIIAAGVALLYFPIMEYYFGWTVGKRLFGLKVLSEDGSPVPLRDAFIRRLSYYFNFLVLDSVFILFSKTKQRAFDRVARTVVVKDEEPRVLGIILLFVLAAVFVLLSVYTIFLLNALPHPVIRIY